MKKSLIALAVLGVVSGSAFAADEVKVYGLVSAGVVHLSGIRAESTGSTSSDDSFTGMADQAHNSNRWGVMGSEDLGGGLKAKFQLESNLSLRTGAAGKDTGGFGALKSSSDPLFDREANVSLESKEFGQIKLGRGKNFLYNVLDEFDSRGNWNFGGLKPVARYAGFYSGSGISRFDSMIRYTSPAFAGFTVDFSKSVGPDDDNSASSLSYGGYNAGIRYDMDNLSVAYTHGESELKKAYVNQKIDLVAVKYAMGDWLFNIGYADTKNPDPTTANNVFSTSKADGKTTAQTWFAGVKYKLNEKITLNAGYYDVTDKVNSDGRNDLQMQAVGVVYAFSKRTEIFADYAAAQRKSTATGAFTLYDRYSAYNTAEGFSDTLNNQSGFVVGVQHRF